MAAKGKGQARQPMEAQRDFRKPAYKPKSPIRDIDQTAQIAEGANQKAHGGPERSEQPSGNQGSPVGTGSG